MYFSRPGEVYLNTQAKTWFPSASHMQQHDLTPSFVPKEKKKNRHSITFQVQRCLFCLVGKIHIAVPHFPSPNLWFSSLPPRSPTPPGDALPMLTERILCKLFELPLEQRPACCLLSPSHNGPVPKRLHWNVLVPR